MPDRFETLTSRTFVIDQEDIDTDQLLGGKKTVLFAVPGAFTPTCSAKHVPGFHKDGGMTGVRQIFRTGETSQSCSRNGDTHALNHNLKTTLKGSLPGSLPKVSSNRKRGVLTAMQAPWPTPC